jgi:hypothetical protein
MYDLIAKHSDLLIGELQRLLDADKYVSLVSQLRATSGDAALDGRFQRLCRDYWRMNVARLSPAFFDRYFHLLAQSVKTGRVDLRSATLHLSTNDDDSPGSLQFSFATKLAHMVDGRLPVYDSFIAAFYFYDPPPSGKSMTVRLNGLMEFHQFLRDEYRRVLDSGLLAPAIAAFRESLRSPVQITDERAIDWLIWAWVAVMRGGAQVRGDIRY